MSVLEYSPEALPLSSDDWQKLEDQGVIWLKELLRIDTTNPPGNETLAAEWICAILDAEGIGYDKIETAPGRSNVIARLEGDGSGKGHEPMALMAHSDVVPHDPKHWTQGAFSGAEVDGWIYGRGAVDMKYMLIENLVSLIALKRSGIKLSRDVIFIALADEEAGCTWGIKWLIENRPELIECRWGINEVGGFPIWLNGKSKAYLVQTAEKGMVWCRVRIPGTPGHGSIPHDDNAVAHTAELISKLQKGIFPHKVTAPTRVFVDHISREMGGVGAILKQVLNPILYPLVRKLVSDPEQRNIFHAILHNTANPTVVQGGQKVNVVPGEVVLEIDGRTLPGETTESFIGKLTGVLPAGAEIEIINEGTPYVVPAKGPLYNAIVNTITDADPGVPVIPYMMSGYSDSKYMEKFGAEIYGFAPVQFPKDVKFTSLIHGHDERTPTAGFRWGMRLHTDLVARFCGSRGAS